MQPSQFPRRILIVVSGMSPQVLTETLHALSQGPGDAFVPTEVHLLSTREGARHARLSLLEGDAHFLRLCEDYGLDRGIFGAGNIHVITGEGGQPLDDIRTRSDNDAAADFITDFIRQKTEDDGAAVHVSIAGGRKTMGYYAGYALSLYGRDQDRLSHVLVSEGFENQRGFYYPTPVSRPVYREGKTALDASEAKLDLALIPFVRMRDELPAQLLDKSALLGGRQGFSEAVAAAESGRRQHRLVLDLPNLQFQIGGEDLLERLGAANMSLLCWMADREARGLPPLSMNRDILRDEDGCKTGQDYARFCERLQDRDEKLLVAARREGKPGKRRLPDLDKTITALEGKGFVDKNQFEYRLSNLRKGLDNALGKRLAEQFRPRTLGRKGDSSYGFDDFEEHFELVPLD